MEETPKAALKSHKIIIISVVAISIVLMLGVLSVSLMMNNRKITTNSQAATNDSMKPASTYENPFASPTPSADSNPFDQSSYQNPFN
jgi:flagellar basal body-associated protein FliL